MASLEGCVNVNMFWGGKIIRRGDDIRYSNDPKAMHYVSFGTTYEELKTIVYNTMNISPDHWTLKLSSKYPQIGIGNVVTGYYIATITSDIGVNRMLNIPDRMQMGLGDVSMFIEPEKIQLNDPYSYEYNTQSQPTQSTYQQDYGTSSQPTQSPYQQDYGTSSQFPEFGTGGWSFNYFDGGCNNETFPGKAGGSSSQAIQQSQNRAEVSPPRQSKTGRELALIDENPVYDDVSATDEDFEEFSDEDDTSEEEAEEVTRTYAVEQGHHVARAPWFEADDYTPVVINNQAGNYLGFNRDSEELLVGQMFRDKQVLIDAIRQVHINTDRLYVVGRSNPEQFIAKCVVENCPLGCELRRKKDTDCLK